MQKPFISENEDGSINLEWIKEDKRFTICLENDLQESSWNFVSKNYDFAGYTLPEKMIEYLNKFFKE